MNTIPIFCVGETTRPFDDNFASAAAHGRSSHPPRLSNRTINFPPSNMISRQRRQRRRAPPYATTSLTGLASSIGFVILLQSSFLVAWIGRHGHGLLFVSAHGYLKSPRSRNLVACESVGRFRRIISTRNLCSHFSSYRSHHWSHHCLLIMCSRSNLSPG